jgi:hypothetical protein
MACAASGQVTPGVVVSGIVKTGVLHTRSALPAKFLMENRASKPAARAALTRKITLVPPAPMQLMASA